MKTQRFLLQDKESGLFLNDRMMLVPANRAQVFSRLVGGKLIKEKYGVDGVDNRVNWIPADDTAVRLSNIVKAGRTVTPKRRRMLRAIARMPRKRTITLELVNILNEVIHSNLTRDAIFRGWLIKALDDYEGHVHKEYFSVKGPMPAKVIDAQDKLKSIYEWRKTQS
jgi:hypothetical protein